MMKTWKKGT